MWEWGDMLKHKPRVGIVLIQKIALLRRALLFGFFIALTSCSSVPDAINPIEWYHATTEFLINDEEDLDADVAEPDNNTELVKNKNVGWWTIFGNDEPQESAVSTKLDKANGADDASQSFPKLSSIDKKVRQADNFAAGLGADPDRPAYAPAIARQGETSQMLASQAPEPALVVPTLGGTQSVPPVSRAASKNKQLLASLDRPESSNVARLNAGDEKAMQGRLAQHLAEIKARSADQSNLLPNFNSSFGVNGLGTLVVSSGGIEVANLADQNNPRIPSLMTNNSLIDNKGALPLPPRSMKVATILFNSGSSGLGQLERQILDDVSRLQKQTGNKVRVVGHASQRTRDMDTVKHKMINFKVSVKRANVVASALRNRGVSDGSILVAAVGDAQPVYYEVMPSGEAGNRRAEIFLDQ